MTAKAARRAVAAAIVALLFAGSAAAAPPPLEAITVEHEIPAPPGVRWVDAVGAAFWLGPQEDHILGTVEVGGHEQAAVIDAGGGGYRCLTCGLVKTMRSPQAFPDGRRLFVGGSMDDGQLGGQGTGDSQYFVLECAPSLVACDRRALLPIQLPIDGLTALPQGAQNREAGISPDGEWLKWTEVRTLEGTRMTIGRLVRAGDHYAVAGPRVMNPGYRLSDDPADWIAAGRFYEAQGYTDGWADGGRVMKYGTEGTSLNYDVWELDLATGARRRLTNDVDYNENGDFSPDGTRIAYASSRGLDRMTVFTQVPRPPFLDMVTFAQIGRIGLSNNRRCMNERWLMDRATGQIAGSYAGQPVITQDDWAIRSWAWSRDGTRALIVEDPIRRASYASGDVSDGARMRVLRFPARQPTTPDPVVHLADLDLARSTVPYDAYVGLAARPVVGKVLHGPGGGRVTLDLLGSFASGTFQARYDRWSEDGRSFLSGTERLDLVNPLVASRYTAHLRLTGAHQGRMDADLLLRNDAPDGSVVSELDGRRLDRVPMQADCPGIRRPPLVLRAARRRGGRVAVSVQARVPGDDRARPVRGALVRAGRRHARTDDSGRAVLRVGRRRVTVTADAGTFAPARRTLP